MKYYDVHSVIRSRYGSFRITSVIEAQRYERVYRALWTQAGREPRDVVVKQIELHGDDSEERVLREVQMTLHLIPSRLGARAAQEFCGEYGLCVLFEFEEPGTADRFLVFPWMQGAMSLKNFVKQEIVDRANVISTAYRDLLMASIADDIFHALGYLQRIGVVHSFIDPSSFVVYVASNRYRVQLINFGLSCSTERLNDEERALTAWFKKLTPEEKRRAAAIKAYNTALECNTVYNTPQTLRDPLANSEELFGGNDTYRAAVGRETVIEKAFTSSKQRRIYYPIFERYGAAALIVYLYNSGYWDYPEEFRVPIQREVVSPPGAPIPAALYRLIEGCTVMDVRRRISSEEAVAMADQALRAAYANYERKPDASAVGRPQPRSAP